MRRRPHPRRHRRRTDRRGSHSRAILARSWSGNNHSCALTQAIRTVTPSSIDGAPSPESSRARASRATRTWQAPDEAGRVPVTVTVDDGQGGTESDTVTIDVSAPPPPPAREYVFENVHFDFNRYTLRAGAARVLDEVVAALQDDPNLSI